MIVAFESSMTTMGIEVVGSLLLSTLEQERTFFLPITYRYTFKLCIICIYAYMHTVSLVYYIL